MNIHPPPAWVEKVVITLTWVILLGGMGLFVYLRWFHTP